MKKTYVLIVVAMTFSFGLRAQTYFPGEWHMQELSEETLQEKKITSNEEIREKGTFWIMKFWEDGKFYQTSNDNARGETVEMEGTWKTEPDERLTIFVWRNGEKRPLKFFYEFKGEDKMVLERYNQLRTLKLVIVFTRAKETESK